MAAQGTPTEAAAVSRGILVALATAAVYVLAAKLGLSLAFVAEQVTTVWPPTGIAIAAIVLLGPRWTCPGIALGAFVANVTAREPVLTAAGIAAGNTLEAFTAAWLLERVGFRPQLTRLRDALALVTLAAAVSAMLSATIGVASLCIGGVQPWSSFGTHWWTWWVGDALGALVVAPLILVWSSPSELGRTGGRFEAAALVGATMVLGLGSFAVPHYTSLADYPLHYTVFPLVIWAALRFGPRETTTVTLLVAALAIWSVVRGSGPVALPTAHERLFVLQLFMAVVAVTGLLLAAAIAERDQTRQEAERDLQRLQVSEGRLRLALDAGRMGVWDWNIATNEVRWSDNLEAIHGLAPGTFPGTLEGFQAIVHPDDRERVAHAIDQAVQNGTGYETDFRNVRSDGSVGWVSAKGVVLRDASGRPARMLGVGMDLSETRRLTAELEVRANELALADRRKDEFLAMLAHELRNPLAPLSTALQLLRSGGTSNDRVLATAERQTRQLARLVDDLLDASRITQGKIALRPEPVLLDDVVTRALETARPAIDARGHVFELSLPAEPIRLEADPARLAQVVANLLDNAAKYTPPGGSIWLTAVRDRDGIVLTVRDTGAGLAPELLPSLFDLFVQGDRSLARSGGGLGIGLTIVRRLVELHGGRVEARSAGVGRGSEFVVHLPAPPPAAPAVVTPQPVPVAPSATPLKVLLVEDNRDSAEVLGMVIELWGHELRVAYDAAAALDMLASWTPDAILSDLGLPRMDGYELARRIRRHPAVAGAVLIALSGYGRDEDKQAAIDAGFDHHLVKPPDLERLADLLSRVTPTSARRSQAV